MFPIIPHNFGRQFSFVPPSVVKCEMEVDLHVKEESVENSVICACFIQKNTISKSISAEDFYKSIRSEKTILMCLSGSGFLVPEEPNFGHSWIKSIKLAKDVHSQNVILETTSDNDLRLRVTKNLAEGDELQMWFSEEIVAVTYIPFLAPANILSEYLMIF